MQTPVPKLLARALALAAVLLSLLATTIPAATIHIDAHALTTPTFSISGVSGGMSTRSVQTLDLAPTTYQFDAHGGFYFTVDANGKIQYDTQYDGFLSGRNTDTLVVRGLTVTVDGRALTTDFMALVYITDSVTTATPLSAVVVPGQYQFDAHGGFFFTIDANGKIQYDTQYDGFLSGRDTDTLVIRGLTVTIDARALATDFMAVAYVTDYVSTATPLSVVVVPGPYIFYTSSGGGFNFTVESSGLLQGLPSTFEGVPVTGNGTRLLSIGSAASRIASLISLVQSLNLLQGIENSLDAKLQNAQAAVNAATSGNLTSACGLLGAFINEVNAQSGKKITSAQAAVLVGAANQIQAALGCP